LVIKEKEAESRPNAWRFAFVQHTREAVAVNAFRRQEDNPLLSVETAPDNISLIDFASFAKDFPEKLFPLLAKLRPEFQEFFIEYYILHKSQSFIGQTHGCIQTRIWQALRIIERTLGSLIVLGLEPTEEKLRAILEKTTVENQECGPLSAMIASYAQTQSYAGVAAKFAVRVPVIRKLFRPALATMLADTDINVLAVGSYLQNMTHQKSLTRKGISKRARARIERMKIQTFDAPPLKDSPLLSFGPVEVLKDTPWHMLEISSDHRMDHLAPLLAEKSRIAFGKKPGQIFAPLSPDGTLAFGYIFVRSLNVTPIRMLTKTYGIASLVAQYDAEGKFSRLVTIPHTDVTDMMQKVLRPSAAQINKHDFVEILSGPAMRYCGTVVASSGNRVKVKVEFPTGRKFVVIAAPESVKKLTAEGKRTFWGILARDTVEQ
jgi:hypothetical protein